MRGAIMLRQISPVLRNVGKFSRVSVVRASSSEHGHEHHKSDLEVVHEYHSTLNDLPVPQGSWQEYYDKRTSTWNMLLGASIVFFAGTMFVLKDYVHFHAFPMSEMKKVKLNVD